MSDFKFEYWPTEHRVITQPFGANPDYYGQFGLPGHEGVDLRAPTGSKIFSVASGRVYRVHRTPDNHNYGIHVRLQHQDGYQTIYGHMEEAFVNQGDTVKAGTVLGLAGNTGNSRGPHLHIMLKKSGVTQNDWPYNIHDPTPYILKLLSWQNPAGPYVSGWMNSLSLNIQGELAQVARDDAMLHMGPNDNILVPEGTLVIVDGETHRGYHLVKVSRASVGLPTNNLPEETAPPPPATVATVYGWAWAAHLNINFEGDQALVNSPHGLNLREHPDNESRNLGVVKRGSTVSIVGDRKAGYIYVQVRRADFVGPVDDPTKPPEATLERPESIPDGVYLGWITSQFLRRNGTTARLPHRSVSLRSAPGNGRYIGTVLGDTTVSIAGQNLDGFTPVLVNQEAFLRIADPIPVAKQPKPINPIDISNGNGSDPGLNAPINQSRGGWVLSGELDVYENTTIADRDGLNLRNEARRDADIIGFVPPGTPLLVTDKAYGEFVPVRVEISSLQPPIQNIGNIEGINPDPPIIARARIGLHASTDPAISEAEHREFELARPGIIKLLSFHSATDIARLAQAHPRASFIVRAFLDFGDRQITPERFLNDTLPDVRRALNELRNREVVIELHNEPNVNAEGLGRSWRNGSEFSRWYLELLELYRRELPASKFIFPGLSPGYSVSGIKEDHIRFAETARDAIEASDGLGVHVYWSKIAPMGRALQTLDDYITRFRSIPIWVTEASNNKGGVEPAKKAREYLKFWHEAQERPIVQGITYFAASSSNPDFAEEVWLGNGISQIVGMR